MTPNKGGRKSVVKGKEDKDIYSEGITIKDSAPGWINILHLSEVRLDLVVNQVDLARLSRYPLPNEIMEWVPTKMAKMHSIKDMKDTG